MPYRYIYVSFKIVIISGHIKIILSDEYTENHQYFEISLEPDDDVFWTPNDFLSDI